MGTEELLFPSFPACQRSQAVSRQNQVNILLMASPKPTISQWLNMKEHMSTINSTADILWCVVMCDWKGTKKRILLFLDLTQLQGLITGQCFESTQYPYIQKPKCTEISGCVYQLIQHHFADEWKPQLHQCNVAGKIKFLWYILLYYSVFWI
jgi:hypothetical protein